MQIIKVPKRLTFEAAADFGCTLSSTEPQHREYVLDFKYVGRVEPFALLYLGSEIDRFASRVEKLRVINHEHMSYADHMGFFRSFGVEGASRNKALGSVRYIPIKIKSTESIKENAAKKFQDVGDYIENICEELASVLAQKDCGVLYDTLVYSFREIMRNVIEHSNSSQFAFCAQYWPSYQKVEAAILDRGDGLRATLSRNPNISVENDHDALNFALMPGVSGKAYKGAPKQRGVWANSGYGLYMTSRLARQGGSFFIASGQVGMYLSEKKRKHLETPLSGVALRITLDVERLSYLKESLDRFREEAQAIASKYKFGKNLDASVASTMLRRDFKSHS